METAVVEWEKASDNNKITVTWTMRLLEVKKYSDAITYETDASGIAVNSKISGYQNNGVGPK